jgi:myo-inositol-1-phosphate synthase
VHHLEAFEAGLRRRTTTIAPSMLYAYAALKEGVPFANGAPNLTVDIPALLEAGRDQGRADRGKDFKTGQTLIKTVLAPGFKARMLGVRAGTRPTSSATATARCSTTRRASRPRRVEARRARHILQPELYPDLYGDIYHVVRINYYPPRGDNKEGWDNIDIFGWLGYPMQIKVDFLCRDSILAAPIVLDLALFLDLAQRAGMKGIQEWLSFYFKARCTRRPACTRSTTCSSS